MSETSSIEFCKIPNLIVDNNRIRHCKIIGTLGPSSSDPHILEQLIVNGLNIARLNFSHGTHEQHLKNIEQIRRISQKTGYTVGILQDLQGPKIRCGQLIEEEMAIEAGHRYRLRYGVKQEDKDTIPIDYRNLVHDVAEGQRVLMDDGLLSFVIIDIQDDTVEVEALNSGHLKKRKGVNFPDSILNLPALTEKDSRDLLFGVANRVDFIALSFVQRAQDVAAVKDMIRALGADTPVIAKIEKINAVKEIDAIAQISDGLMVARGDLGVEASVEKVPAFQKRIIAAAQKYAKPVIIATQMLESMVNNPRPSLAEVADVANGVLDGADCLMLSAEVASGKYPVECVKTMASIIEKVESWVLTQENPHGPAFGDHLAEPTKWLTHEAIAIGACEAAIAVGAKAIISLSLTGNIAKQISRWRPPVPIIAISPRHDVIQRLSLVWGNYGLANPLFYDTDKLLADLPRTIKQLGFLKSGDLIVITAGIPLNKMSATNMIKVNRIP